MSYTEILSLAAGSIIGSFLRGVYAGYRRSLVGTDRTLAQQLEAYRDIQANGIHSPHYWRDLQRATEEFQATQNRASDGTAN